MTHYLKGLDYAAAGQYGQAQSEWQFGVWEDPSSPQCWEQLGDFYTQAHQYVKAERCYEQTTHLLPDDGMQFLQLARTEKALGNSPAAMAAAKRAAMLIPNNADALALYGSLEGDLDNRPAALGALERAFALRPLDRGTVLALAYVDLRGTDNDAAVHHLTPYLQAHPEDPEACYLMAYTLLQQASAPGPLLTALASVQRAQKYLPKDVRVYSVEGKIDLRLNRPQDALIAFQAGRRVDPYSEGILQGVLTSEVRLGQTQKANVTATELQQVTLRHNRIEHLEQMSDMKQNSTADGLELARLQEEEGENRVAQTQLEQTLRRAPRDPRAHAALAAFLQRMGRPDLAKQVARPNFVLLTDASLSPTPPPPAPIAPDTRSASPTPPATPPDRDTRPRTRR